MATNRSSFFQMLDDAPEVYTEIFYKQSGGYASISAPETVWRVYAVTANNQGLAEVAKPKWPFLLLASCKSKAAAGAAAGKFKRWLKEYNDDF